MEQCPCEKFAKDKFDMCACGHSLHQHDVDDGLSCTSEAGVYADQWARAFRLVLPDGSIFDGAHFPGGIVMAVPRELGHPTLALSFGDLPQLKEFPESVVEWEPDEQQTIDSLIETVTRLKAELARVKLSGGVEQQ